MYTIEYSSNEVIIHGPEGYEKRVPKCAVGIVIREDLEQPWPGALRPYAVQVDSMTKSEAVAFALEIQAYPC